MISVAVCDDNKPMLDFIYRHVSEQFVDNNMECTISTFVSGKSLIASRTFLRSVKTA